MTTLKLKSYVTESVMVRECGSPVYGSNRIIIRVCDEAAGPYLAIHGETDQPDDDGTEHDIYLESEDDIDAFAATCKAMLKQAEEAENAAPVAVVK